MNLQTPVIIHKAAFDISHRATILLFGSCFSENIGLKLVENKFSVNVNPFGILYNPISIYNAMTRLLDKRGFGVDDFIPHNNLHHSFMHHGSFSKTNLNDAVASVNDSFALASSQLRSADILLITFGTSYVFRWNKSGEIVGNCHKIPGSEFTRERLTIEEITSTWRHLLTRLIDINPSLKILFTVSPIRHFKDGAHENQLSKSILHLSIDSLMQQFSENTFYFPAYEILMDQLRDYRFYKDDMLHPSTLAQDYIWQRFGETYFSKETHDIISQWQRIYQSLSHKPFDLNSAAYQKFLQRTINDIEAFEKEYSFISCFHEKQHLTELITNI